MSVVAHSQVSQETRSPPSPTGRFPKLFLSLVFFPVCGDHLSNMAWLWGADALHKSTQHHYNTPTLPA